MTINKNFRGQIEGENVVCAFRRHWISIISHLMSLPLLLLVLGLGFRYFPWLTRQGALATVIVFTGLAVTTYLIHRQFMTIFRYYLSTVIITNFRIIEQDKSVFFRDSKDSIDLSKIQDVQKFQNGILENILNFGTLSIVLSGTHATVNISLVPRPDYQFKKINGVKSKFIHGGASQTFSAHSLTPQIAPLPRKIPVERW